MISYFIYDIATMEEHNIATDKRRKTYDEYIIIIDKIIEECEDKPDTERDQSKMALAQLIRDFDADGFADVESSHQREYVRKCVYYIDRQTNTFFMSDVLMIVGSNGWLQGINSRYVP